MKKDMDHNSRLEKTQMCSVLPDIFLSEKYSIQCPILRPPSLPHQLQRNRPRRELTTLGLLWYTENLSFNHQKDLWKCQNRPALSHISPDVALLEDWGVLQLQPGSRAMISAHVSPLGYSAYHWKRWHPGLRHSTWLATAQGPEQRPAGQKDALARCLRSICCDNSFGNIWKISPKSISLQPWCIAPLGNAKQACASLGLQDGGSSGLRFCTSAFWTIYHQVGIFVNYSVSVIQSC